MSNIIEYRGFEAEVVFDADDMSFIGTVRKVKPIINFCAKDIESLVSSFHKSIDAHLILSMRKEGYWKDRGDENDFTWSECSECGFIEDSLKTVKVGRSSTDYIGVKYNFCPICGAHMSLKEEVLHGES